MPQLNIETYVTQYFWTIVILFGFYYFNVTSFIPKVSQAFKVRKKLEGAEAEALQEMPNVIEGKSVVKGYMGEAAVRGKDSEGAGSTTIMSQIGSQIGVAQGDNNWVAKVEGSLK